MGSHYNVTHHYKHCLFTCLQPLVCFHLKENIALFPGFPPLHYVTQIRWKSPCSSPLPRPSPLSNFLISYMHSIASFPGSPGTQIFIARRAWYLFVRKHDVSKIGPNRKATFCAFFNQLCFNARCVCYSMPNSYIHVVSCPLPSLFFLF